MKNLFINLCLIVVTPFYWLNTLIETFEGTPIFSFFIGCYITCKIIYESIFHSTDYIIIKIIGCTIYISIAWVLAMILSACEGLLDLIILLLTQPFCSLRLYLKRCLKTESAQRGQQTSQTNRNASGQRQQSSSGARCRYRSAEDARRAQEEAKKREEEARKQEEARREKEEEEAATRRYEKARREFEEYMREEFEKSERERRRRMEEEARKRREEEARRNRRPTKEQEIQTAMKILGLKPGFTKAELRSRRKELAKRYHPDVGGSPELFKRINAAYDTLEKLC